MSESKTRNSGIVRHDELSPLGGVVLNPDLPLLQAGADEDHGGGDVGEVAEALRVGDGLDLVQHLEIGEVVHKDLVRQDHHDAVAPETDALHLGAEGELTDAAGLVVVPDHNLVGGVAGVGAAADKGEYVAAEEHVDKANAASGAEIAAEDLPEGVAVVDAEAAVGGRREASGILVEGEVEERGGMGVGGLGGGGGGGGHLLRIEGLRWCVGHYWEWNRFDYGRNQSV